MKRLLRNERVMTLGVALGLLAVIAACAAMLAFALDTRSTAKDSQVIAAKAVASEQQLRATIIGRCHDRQAYDQRFVRAAQDDADTYQRLLDLMAPATAGASPEQAKAREAYIVVITRARDRKLAIVNQGVIGNCEVYTAKP